LFDSQKRVVAFFVHETHAVRLGHAPSKHVSDSLPMWGDGDAPGRGRGPGACVIIVVHAPRMQSESSSHSREELHSAAALKAADEALHATRRSVERDIFDGARTGPDLGGQFRKLSS